MNEELPKKYFSKEFKEYYFLTMNNFSKEELMNLIWDNGFKNNIINLD